MNKNEEKSSISKKDSESWIDVFESFMQRAFPKNPLLDQWKLLLHKI